MACQHLDAPFPALLFDKKGYIYICNSSMLKLQLCPNFGIRKCKLDQRVCSENVIIVINLMLQGSVSWYWKSCLTFIQSRQLDGALGALQCRLSIASFVVASFIIRSHDVACIVVSRSCDRLGTGEGRDP